jgi:hypothetical protein
VGTKVGTESEEQVQGAWRRESNRLHAEIAARLYKLRSEGLLLRRRQLEDWLSRLRESLIEQLGLEE